MAVQIDAGASDGTDLSGLKVALGLELPGDFVSGVIDAAKLYVDEAVSDEQRAALEGVFQGKQGGGWEGVAGMIRKWAATEAVPIGIDTGDEPSATIGAFGGVSLTRVKTEDGAQAQLLNSPVGASLGFNEIDLALADGSGMSDPALREWKSLGYGAVTSVAWSA